MQDPMDEWKKIDIDPKNPKSYDEFRDYCIKEDNRLTTNKQRLGKIGIANAVTQPEVNEDPRMEIFEESIMAVAKACAACSTEIKELKELQKQPPQVAWKDDSNAAAAALLAQMQLLAAPQCAPLPDPKVAALEKQLADVNYTLKNITNGPDRSRITAGGNRTEKKWERKLVTFNKYCSSCGVNHWHVNDNCPPKLRQSWHKEGATWEDKKGGNTSKDNMWGKTVQRRVLVPK
jgi:hypothetical protein